MGELVGLEGSSATPSSISAFEHGCGCPAPMFVSDPADAEPVRLIRYGADQQRPTAGHDTLTPGGEGGGVGRRGVTARPAEDAAGSARRWCGRPKPGAAARASLASMGSTTKPVALIRGLDKERAPPAAAAP